MCLPDKLVRYMTIVCLLVVYFRDIIVHEHTLIPKMFRKLLQPGNRGDSGEMLETQYFRNQVLGPIKGITPSVYRYQDWCLSHLLFLHQF